MHQIFLLANKTAELALWTGLKDLMANFLEKLFDLTMSMGIPSYALAIFIFTIIIKVVLYPLTVKQMRSTRNMQRIQPLIKEVEKKHKSNPKRYQEELSKLYKTYNVNPLGGCLPLLLQMPIMIALYRVLMTFEPMHQQYYSFLWLENLSLPDPTGIVLPLIVAGSTFLQQYLSTTNKNDSTQKIMLYAMPIMFGFFARNFAAGLAIYWSSYSLVGAIQQVFINRGAKKEVAEFEAKVEEERIAKLSKKNKPTTKKEPSRELTPAEIAPDEANDIDGDYEIDYEDIKPYDRKPKKKKKVTPAQEDKVEESAPAEEALPSPGDNEE